MTPEGPRERRSRRTALAALRRHWFVLVAIPLVVGVAAYFTQVGAQKRYEATARVLLQSNDLGATLAGVPDLGRVDPERVVATEKEIASVPEVRSKAEAELKARGSDLAKSATIQLGSAKSFSDGNSDVLEISATADDPAFAERFATAVARQYIAFRAQVSTGEISKARAQVEKRMAEIQGVPAASQEYSALLERAQTLDTLLLVGSGRASLLAPAQDATEVAPNPLRRSVVAAVLSFLFSVLVVVAVSRFDTSAGSEEEVSESLGAPVLANLPDPRRLGKRGTVISLFEPQAAETESFRRLRANLRFSLLGRNGHSVGVTSAVEAEGKSFVASNLAVVAAAAGARVALVDLDLRRPVLHRFFAQERTPGVSDVLTRSASLEESLLPIEIPSDFAFEDGAIGSLSLLPAGTQAPNPGEIMASMALDALLRDLEERFELVIVDTPPTTIVSDAIPLAALVSGMIAVVRLPNATRPHLEALSAALEGAGGPMGVVLTAAWKAPSAYYAYNPTGRDLSPRSR